MAVRSPLINVMMRAAEKAGRALVRDFGEVEQLQVAVKGPSDFVSTADLKAERICREELTKARPDFGYLMEESTEVIGRDAAHRWIVDPLDGTTNFLHGIPHFAVSIALEREGELIAGVIYNPITPELYWAEKGSGAYLNDRRLRVSGRRDLGLAVIGTGILHKGRGDHPHYLQLLQNVMAEAAGIRRLGAASLDLAYVAAGRYDGYFEEGLKPWDVAAGIVLVREAGGTVIDYNDAPKTPQNPYLTGTILATNAYLGTPLQALLKGEKVKADAK